MRTAKTPSQPPRPPTRWPLQDAKADFSELVRRARSEGPQLVTVHGQDEVVVVTADEFRRLKGERTGRSLIDALQASPSRGFEIEPGRVRMPYAMSSCDGMATRHEHAVRASPAEA